jgi:hypothetical protein
MDDLRPAPEGYYRVCTVEEAAYQIRRWETEIDIAWENYILKIWDRKRLDKYLDIYTITEISCDHDLGDGNADGIRLLDWLEATGRNYPIRIHSRNPVGVENMRRIIQRNGWTEVF